MKMFLYRLAFMVLAIAILPACNINSVYQKFKPITENGWNKDSVMVFEVPVDDTIQNHNIFINVRNEIDYSFSNIWLFIEIEQPDGKAIKDTFEITLAGPTGKWLGEGFGKRRTHQAIFRRNVYFPEKGTYRVKIQQGMREENLKGISDVGLTIKRNDPKDN